MWKVLVVEDDPMLAEIHRRYIESQDEFECVDIAKDIPFAQAAIEKHDPDLIILDVYLPQMTGIEFLIKLREQGRTVDVILITAAREFSKIEKAFQYGAIDYLIKPFEFDRLKQSLDVFLKRKSISEPNIELDQTKLDSMFVGQSTKADVSLPKGVHERTLDRVKHGFDGLSEAVSIEEIASKMSMSKVALRRYLEYLEKIGFIDIEMSYGTRGRPSYLYKRKK